MLHLILYSKPGCHLCEGLQEKLSQIQEPPLKVEIRDITSRADWFAAYEYEVPVLYYLHRDPETGDRPRLIPRPSPRASVQQLQRLLAQYVSDPTHG
ncbi:MAG: glutaredoxin family protein [Aphanocapsa sp. GSE-SYN-MK-11-07L]|nr:glutaredoxin family protein [Aphanocapsa sp. GSE-SYN-MK-11-07L]